MTKKVFLSLLHLFPVLLFVQVKAQDQSFLETSVENVVKHYENRFSHSLLLHTGSEYINYDIGIKGHPYFLDDDFTLGTVVVKEQKFTDVPLLYDTYKDKLVLEHYNEFDYFGWLEVITEKVDSFSIHGYTFFRVKNKSDFNGQLPVGFYNLLHDGHVKAISKRSKAYSEVIDNRVILKEFLLKDKYFLVKDGTVFQVRSKGAVMKVYKDRKKELKTVIREEDIKFKPDFERGLIRITQIYNEIEKSL